MDDNKIYRKKITYSKKKKKRYYNTVGRCNNRTHAAPNTNFEYNALLTPGGGVYRRDN